MSAATPNTKTGGVTNQKLIDLGRPAGPDLQLKFDPKALEFQVSAPSTITTDGIIREDSSITEVLNILSFLISADRKFDNIVDADNSAATEAGAGQIDLTTGYYTDNNATGAFQEFSPAPFSLSTLVVTAADVHFPVSILKRRGVVDTDPANPNSFEVDMNKKQIKNDATATESVKSLFVDSVKQMIKILTKTRMVLGPKGWTDLFQKVKGGSKNSKKTHRRHRRKYSSKQY
jgi:hypothetical protein